MASETQRTIICALILPGITLRVMALRYTETPVIIYKYGSYFHSVCCVSCMKFGLYRGADKSLARPISRCIFFDGENISFDASLVIYIYIYIYIYIVLIFLQL